MTILVTGGAGYIGSSLVQALNKMPKIDKIIVLDNRTRTPLSFFIGSQKLSKVKFIHGDILDSFILEEILQNVDIVYHLAGFVLSPYSYEQNIQYEQINKWGTLNLVRSIQNVKHKIRRFVYLSSASVYGLRGEIKVSDSPNPTNAYGKSKLEGERFVQLLKDDCNVHIIRSANVFGFNKCFREDSVLNHFIFNTIIFNKILIYGDGTQSRPFIPLSEIVQILINQLTSTNSNEEVISAASFNANLNEIKDWLIKEHSKNLEYTYINPGLQYEKQKLIGIKPLSEYITMLNSEFDNFKQNLVF